MAATAAIRQLRRVRGRPVEPEPLDRFASPCRVRPELSRSRRSASAMSRQRSGDALARTRVARASSGTTGRSWTRRLVAAPAGRGARRPGHAPARARPAPRWRSAARGRCPASDAPHSAASASGPSTRALTGFSCKLPPEVMRQQRHVLHAVAKRRHPDADDGQAEQQVVAEAPWLAAQSERPVGRRHDPDVDRPRHVLAEPPDFALLQGPQQLGLRARRQLANLVEEKRAADAPPRRARRGRRRRR